MTRRCSHLSTIRSSSEKHEIPSKRIAANYIFANYKYISPVTLTNLYTIDHSKITGDLRNYDPIKQYFCLLPHNDTSRPLIVPQEYLVHFNDILLPCNIPTVKFKPPPLFKHLVSSPLVIKMHLNIPVCQNNHTHLMNYSLSLPKSYHFWSNQNKTQNTNLPILNAIDLHLELHKLPLTK